MINSIKALFSFHRSLHLLSFLNHKQSYVHDIGHHLAQSVRVLQIETSTNQTLTKLNHNMRQYLPVYPKTQPIPRCDKTKLL